MDFVYLLIATVSAYLVGSLSFAVIVSRLMGLNDPRSYGSGNPGATNVLRSGSKAAAALTLLLDGVKGWLPVALVQWKGQAWGLGEGALAAVGLAAFLGHLYPLFFKFQGGKGVATAAGVLLGLHPFLGLAVLAVWLGVAFLSRYSSLAALLAALAAPVLYLMLDRIWWYSEGRIVLALVIMSALLIWRHRSNIAKLIRGQESRIGSKAKG
ncbi:MAG: glycerol-3-phosphate 1-O-acyltransferase PlsY [Betaproteobacteria bacterium]|nr:glycerol-3-phosphate 1-O-acyltransferase PlsY [Betaproteobacteria bacterium]